MAYWRTLPYQLHGRTQKYHENPLLSTVGVPSEIRIPEITTTPRCSIWHCKLYFTYETIFYLQLVPNLYQTFL
jgi:hypothetical protein